VTRLLKILLPIAIVAVGAIVATAMIKSRKPPETRETTAPAPSVRVQLIEFTDVQMKVQSQGTVSPRTESTLLPEVAGRVTWVTPNLASGGFFEKDDVLLRIDTHDYEQAVVQARAAVAQSRLRLAQELAEADVARQEWQDLGQGEAPPLTLRVPQLAQAEAAVASAEAVVQRAERDLARTEIRAPYAGRVRHKHVGVGQYVAPGTILATIYSVDYAEIRLPLPDADLAYIDLPLDYRGETASSRGPRVTLTASFAGRRFEWHGRIVRTEGEIDLRSRMVHVVASVKDPYGRGDDPDRPPLAAGLFVDAEIEGRTVRDVVVIPRSAVRGDDQVLVVADDDRLHFRTIEILRRKRDKVVVSAGLAGGERLCVSPLSAVTDGMRVRPVADGSS